MAPTTMFLLKFNRFRLKARKEHVYADNDCLVSVFEQTSCKTYIGLDGGDGFGKIGFCREISHKKQVDAILDCIEEIRLKPDQDRFYESGNAERY